MKKNKTINIVLVNPPSRFLINDNVFPTLGLLYLSAYLKQAGFENVSLFDLNGNHVFPDTIDADIVGFYSNTAQFPVVVELKKKLQAINKNKSASYVIGGPHVSGIPQDATPYFDYIVIGEGEQVFADIVKGIASGKRLTDQLFKYPYIDDLDSLPFPDRSLINIKEYKYFIEGKPSTTLITSRGCPFACAFCANNAWGKTLRLRSPDNIVAEMKLLIDQYGFNAFMFFDDTMTVHRKRMEILCEKLKELNIIYRCFIRADTVDKEILLKMKKSGCVEVGMGMESGSQRILNLIDKKQTVEQNLHVVKLCKKIGIRIKGFFVVGLPGENRESIQDTINVIEKSQVDDFDITIYVPYPGSKIYREKNNYDINFEHSYENLWYKGRPGFYKSIVSTSALTSEEIVHIRDDIEKRFKKEVFAHASKHCTV